MQKLYFAVFAEIRKDATSAVKIRNLNKSIRDFTNLDFLIGP